MNNNLVLLCGKSATGKSVADLPHNNTKLLFIVYSPFEVFFYQLIA